MNDDPRSGTNDPMTLPYGNKWHMLKATWPSV